MKNYSLAPANFDDYRDFLKSRYEEIKAAYPGFSLLACARKGKISKALLQFLFKKQRHISLDKFTNLARTLRLTADEEYFVYLMICKNASQNKKIKIHFEQILSRIRHAYVNTQSTPPPLSKESEKSLYHNYILMVLQTMTKLDGFVETPEWVLEHLVVNDLRPEIIREAFTQLEEEQYLYRDKDRTLKAHANTLWRPDPLDPTGQSVYRLAAESIAQLLKYPERYKPSVYMAMSLSMDEENLLAAERYMIEVHHHLNALSNRSTKPTAVVYIGNFMLALARLKK